MNCLSNFYPEPKVLDVIPRVGTTSGGTKLTITGKNFYAKSHTGGSSLNLGKSIANGVNFQYQEGASCRVGRNLYPAVVLSDSVLTCITGPTTITKPTFMFHVLGPHIRKEVQRLEIWQRLSTFNDPTNGTLQLFRDGENLGGAFKLYLEGYGSITGLDFNCTSYELESLIETSFPRARQRICC